ncbi:MAG: glycosyltransferase [Opitutaceae bacterium]|nr:glycosyltransferase [Cytophagales bacterium]
MLNQSEPIVTVICTCYNHEKYVEEAITSVLNQTYNNVQLIVVDNASSDNSIVKIKGLLDNNPSILFIKNNANLGICKAFNEAVKYAKGEYLIDLSADDILLPNRIEIQLKEFEKLDDSYGMIYSHIEYINADGKLISNTKSKQYFPSGDIFKNILEEYIIPSPSTIFRKTSFLNIGSYNEDLAFEDFDFWVKCSYFYKIHFVPVITTQKRILGQSLSTQFYSTESDKMLRSTLSTFIWAHSRLRNTEELNSFQKGLSYYFRQSVLYGHLRLAKEYYEMMIAPKGIKTYLAILIFKSKVNISPLFRLR